MAGYDDNSCIEIRFIDDCNETHDIRPGGIDGSAGTVEKDYGDKPIDDGGVYGGADGAEPVPKGRIEYMRDLPCREEVDMKAIRTLLYRGFKKKQELCQNEKHLLSINGDADGGLIEPNSQGEYVFKRNDGVEWRIKPPVLTMLPNPVSLWSSAGEVPLTDLPLNFTSPSIASHVPSSANGLIIRAYIEIDLIDSEGSANQGSIVDLDINNVNSVMSIETGGATGGEDNSSQSDLHIPYTGNIVTARLHTGAPRSELRAETRASLIGWY